MNNMTVLNCYMLMFALISVEILVWGCATCHYLREILTELRRRK